MKSYELRTTLNKLEVAHANMTKRQRVGVAKQLLDTAMALTSDLRGAVQEEGAARAGAGMRNANIANGILA